MKWLVLWVAINSYIVPCPSDCGGVDEYGIENPCTETLAIACWHTDREEMSREFYTFNEAKHFVLEGLERGIEGFEIKRITE